MIDQFEKDLKDQQCQWLIRGSYTSTWINGELKEVSPDNFLDSVTFRIGGTKKKGTRISVNKPIEMKREENTKFLKYTVFSNGVPVLTGGYLKDT